MGIRMDAISSVFSITVAVGVVYGRLIGVGNAGYALSQVLGFATEIFWVVRYFNRVELACTSLDSSSIETFP
jgi:hypothetical protein